MAEDAAGTIALPAEGGTAAPATAPPTASPGAQPGGAQAQADYEQISKQELAELRSNAGRFRHLSETGGVQLSQYLKDKGLTAAEVRDTLDVLGNGLADGYTVGQVLEAMRDPNFGQEAGAGAGQARPPAQGADDDNRPMTVAEYRRIQQETEESARQRREQETKEKTQQEQQAEIRKAKKAAEEHWENVLAKQLKLEAGTAKYRSARGLIDHATDRAIAEALRAADPLLTEQQAMDRAGKLIPTAEHLQKATEFMGADWKDLGHEIVSDAAQGQAGMPGGTLGEGAGGPAAPPGAAGSMTPADVSQARWGAIESAARKKGYEPSAD